MLNRMLTVIVLYYYYYYYTRLTYYYMLQIYSVHYSVLDARNGYIRNVVV